MAPSDPFYFLSLSSGSAGIAAAAGERHACPRAAHGDGAAVVTVTRVPPLWKRSLLKTNLLVLPRGRESHTSSFLGKVALRLPSLVQRVPSSIPTCQIQHMGPVVLIPTREHQGVLVELESKRSLEDPRASTRGNGV